MAAEKIGDARCPLCKASSARVSLSKSGLAVLVCNGCNMQLFTRSGRSDELVRGLIVAAPAPGPAPAPTTPLEVAAVPVQNPAPPPTKKGLGGLFSGLVA